MVDPVNTVKEPKVETPEAEPTPVDSGERSPEFDALSKELEEMDVEAEADKGSLAFDEKEPEPRKGDADDAKPKDDGSSDDQSGDEADPVEPKGKEKSADDDSAGGKKGDDVEAEMDPEGKFSKELVAQAEEFGFSAEDLKEIGTPEHLQEVVDQFIDHIAQRGQAASAYPNVPAQAAPVVESVKKPVVKKSEDEPAASDDEGDTNFLEGLDDFEPEFVEAVNGALGKIQKGFDDRIAKMEQAAVAQEEVQFQRERVEFEKNFDTYIEGLGEGFHDVVGKGSSREVSRAMNQGRQKILEQALVMERGYQDLGMTIPDFDSLMKQATRNVFGNKFETNAKRALIEKAKTRSRSSVNRPGNRVTVHDDSKDEDQDAMEWGTSFLNKLGVKA